MPEFNPFAATLNLVDRSVLVLGGGAEAEDKVVKLLGAGARVTLVAEQVTQALHEQVLRGAVSWYARYFHVSDVAGVHLVMLTEQDPALGARLRALKSEHGFWLCAIDQPSFSDVFLVSTLQRGPVQIGISTGGDAPLLSRRLRQAFEQGLDAQFGEFARKFAVLRARLRALPKAQRKERLEAALNGFAIEVRVSYPPQNPSGEDASGDG